MESFEVLELRARLCRWFVELRWMAVGGAALTILVAYLLGVRLPLKPLFGVLVLIILYNLLFTFLTRPERCRVVDPQRISLTQAVADLMALTLLLHFSGGIENPFIFYFVFHMVIASVLLPARMAYGLAWFATALFGGMVLLEQHGIIRHYHLDPLPILYQSDLLTGGILVAFTATLHFTTFMSVSIVARLRRREREVMTLSQQLQQKADELSAAYDRLSQLEQMKSQHLRKMSHELRAPLNAAQSLLEVIKLGVSGEPPSKSSELVERVSVRLDEMRAMVSDMLSLSRVREAKLEQEREWVDLKSLLSQTVESLRPQAETKTIRLQVELDDSSPPIWGIAEALREIAVNLVGNAIRYTPAGGAVRVTLSHQGEAMVLQVQDTGIGIPQEDQPHVFQEFYRTRNAKEFAHEGTGLGLAIVKAAVEAHHGRIGVQSEVGQGTVFTVTLPFSDT